MRSIPDPGFADDDGGSDPVVAAALAAYDGAGQADASSAHLEALAVLQDSRVLVPVVAILGELEDEVPPGGGVASELPREKSSDMAAVLMTGQDGRTALLAFTAMAALDRWARSYAGGEARPVPVPVRQAARAALQDQAAALLVDVAGPVLFVIEGEDLESLAAGHRLVRLDERWAWVR
jgi:type III secretion system (T3SS) SseB-like protein